MLLKQLALFSITAKWNTEEPLFTFVFIGILPNWNSPDTPPYTNRNKIRLISYFSFDSVPVWCRRFLNYSLPALFWFLFSVESCKHSSVRSTWYLGETWKSGAGRCDFSVQPQCWWVSTEPCPSAGSSSQSGSSSGQDLPKTTWCLL